MEGFEQSHSVSLSTVPDPQDLVRDIQLTSTGLPSTLDEGTRKSTHLPEGTDTHPQDSGRNKQPLDRDITSTTPDESTAKTMPCLEGLLVDKDSGGNIPPADMEPIHTPVADLSGTGANTYVKFPAARRDAKIPYWKAIKNMFGGNKESKKIQKTILKQNYENFAASSQEGLDKTYDRFQKLISQLEIHGEVISHEDANIKFMDDLYNNMKVYESEIKGKLSSSSNSQNVAFVSSDNFSSTNETINTAHSVSTASSKDQASTASYADDISTNDLEEMDLKWQVAEEGITNFALMAYTSQGSSSSDFENEAIYEEDIAFLKYDVQVKDISIKDLKNQLEEALKEKDDLKLKLEKFEESSKNLTKLINSQISAKDKTGLGYDSQINKSEVVHSVFNSRESDVDDSPVNDRFKTGEGFHAVPPPYTGNYMPSRPDLSFAGLDDSVYKTKVSETETSISKTSKDIIEKPKTVRPSAPIIEEWDTDSDNDSVFRPKSDQTKLKFTKINFVKSGENVKTVNKENIHKQVEYPRKSQSPRDNRRN
ncbi:hypothetical protein Tco_0409471 [Tanacetum coccineum]